MSYTTIYLVPESGSVQEAGEFQNAFGSGPYIWSSLCKAHFGDDLLWIQQGEGKGKRMWDLMEIPGVPAFVRITLGTTCDKVMVRKENIAQVAEAFRTFVGAYPPGKNTCSLLGQADLLEKLAADPNCFAVCWCQTSVADDMWTVFDETDDDEDYHANRYYDVSRDEGHWFLFDELPNIEE